MKMFILPDSFKKSSVLKKNGGGGGSSKKGFQVNTISFECKYYRLR